MLGTGIPLTRTPEYKVHTILERNNKTASPVLVKYTVHKLWIWKSHQQEASLLLYSFFFLPPEDY